ncbi:GLRX2 [Branchiostoma lanceolatum]|uniref:Glutaredoxin-2, mitochondrial n=2 Tax=Branchiostoma lanceolatum TaxID=7740 RepID=A0A8J9ZH43_BRALA|nr:GLRX2 [Branchiostoma lanceolatum]
MGNNQSSSDPEQLSMSKEFVEATIRDNKVVVFSKTYCPYCKMAKQELNKYKGQYKEEPVIIEIENRKDCEQIQQILGKITGGRTVPRVFINGKCIGGGSETKAAENSGQLKVMLSDAGSI